MKKTDEINKLIKIKANAENGMTNTDRHFPTFLILERCIDGQLRQLQNIYI